MAEKAPTNAPFDAERHYVGEVYAKALLAAAVKAGQADPLRAEFDSLLDDVIRPLPKLEALLSSARVPHAEKEPLLERCFAGRMSPLLLNFLKVLSRNGRLDCLRAVHRAYRRQDNARRGRREVTVRTAVPLEGELRQQVTSGLEQVLGSEVELQAETDPTLLGGIVVRIGDTLFDGSVANRFARMREAAQTATARAVRDSLDRFLAE